MSEDEEAAVIAASFYLFSYISALGLVVWALKGQEDEGRGNAGLLCVLEQVFFYRYFHIVKALRIWQSSVGPGFLLRGLDR